MFAQENNFIVLDIQRQESEDLEGTIISVSKEAGAELIKDDVLEVIISSGSTDDGADDGGE